MIGAAPQTGPRRSSRAGTVSRGSEVNRMRTGTGIRRLASARGGLGATVALMLGAAAPAGAADPGKWLLTGASSVPANYWQGLTTDPQESQIFFIGVFQGMWRTTPALHQTAGV